MNTKVKILISFLFTIFFFFGCSNGSSGEDWEISGVDCCKTLNEFTITFNTRGGSTIEDMKVEKGTYVFAEDPFYELGDDLTEFTLPEPTKEGASFVGWIDLSGKAVFSKSSVHADYREYHEGGYSGHGGSVSYYEGLVYYDSDTLELTAIWKSENPGTFIYANGGKYSNGKEFLIVEEDMNYDSDWTKIEEPVKDGHLVVRYEPHNISRNFDFEYLIYFSEDFKYYDDDSLGLQGFDNFYSIFWSPKNTVSFETNGGSAIESVDFASNYNLLNSGIPTKDGYIFAGWYVDNELSTVVPLERSWDSIQSNSVDGRFVNNTCKVYAKWVASSYSVTQDNAVKEIEKFYKALEPYFMSDSNNKEYIQFLDESLNIQIKGLLDEGTLSSVAQSISGRICKVTEIDETSGEEISVYKPFVKVNLDISKVSGLTKIPDSCFYKSSLDEASSITSITIAEGVSEIGKSAFSRCPFLTNVSIPASVKTIGDSTFSKCTSLKEIKLPEGVAVLGSSVFDGCSSLNSIVLPSTIIEIGNSSFQNCTSLKTINLPIYLTQISNNMFSGCTVLSEISFGTDIVIIGSSVFKDCSSLANITLPSGIHSIGSSAFENCVKLSSIDIPANVKEISYSTFYGCSSLVSVTLKDKIESIGNFAFAKCSSLTTVTLPNSTLYINNSAFSECAGLTSINLGSNLTSIGEKAFYNCGSLKEITLPETMESLGVEAFNSCSLLQTINIPGTVAELPKHLFQNCISLKNVTLNSGTQIISDRTFYDCKSLESISLPSTISEIKQCAFYGCSKLSAITIPSSCKKIGDSVFVNCGALKSVAFASKDNWFITDNPKFMDGEVVDVSNDSTNANSFTGTNAKKFWYVSE